MYYRVPYMLFVMDISFTIRVSNCDCKALVRIVHVVYNILMKYHIRLCYVILTPKARISIKQTPVGLFLPRNLYICVILNFVDS